MMNIYEYEYVMFVSKTQLKFKVDTLYLHTAQNESLSLSLFKTHLGVMNQLEPQHITIKLQTLDGVLHTKHGLLHDVIFGFGRTLTRHEGRDVRLRHGRAVGHFERG